MPTLSSVFSQPRIRRVVVATVLVWRRHRVDSFSPLQDERWWCGKRSVDLRPTKSRAKDLSTSSGRRQPLSWPVLLPSLPPGWKVFAPLPNPATKSSNTVLTSSGSVQFGALSRHYSGSMLLSSHPKEMPSLQQY